MAQSQQKPPQRVWRCFTCGKVVQAARNAAGQIVCADCGNPVSPELERPANSSSSSSSVMGMPTPQPKPQPKPAAAQADARRPQRPATGPVRVPAKSGSRPGTPAEAIALSSGAWMPSGAPEPSPELSGAAGNAAVAVAPRATSGKPLLIGGAVAAVAVLAVVVAVVTHKPGDAGKGTQQPQEQASVAPRPPPEQQASATAAPSPAASPSPSTTTPEPSLAPRRVVDLLALVDLSRDVASGQWKAVPSGISSDDTKWARLCLPYEPPEEYDFRIEFTRASATNESLLQMFRVNGHSCTWVLNGWKGTICAFNTLMAPGTTKAYAIDQNPTAYRNFSLPAGERHVSIVKVRKDRVEAYLDDKLVARHETDGSDLSMSKDWNLGRKTTLGVGSNTSATVFHGIEVVEVTGHGKVNTEKLVIPPPTTQAAGATMKPK